MKKTVGLGLLVIILALGFIGCDNGNNGSTSVSFIGYDAGGNRYVLEITEDPNRVTFNPQSGDNYVLTIYSVSGSILGKSTGKVTNTSGGIITLERGGTTFSVAVIESAISTIDDAIPLDRGGTIPPPATLMPNKPANVNPPVFTLTNINSTHQSEGSDWFVFGIFAKGTDASIILSDAKKHRNNDPATHSVVAYAGGNVGSIPWQGTPPGELAISSILTTAIDHRSVWNSSGEYDGWVLVFNGSVWNGYKLVIDVQGNVSRSTADFIKTITNQP